jgi:hypothetical protein
VILVAHSILAMALSTPFLGNFFLLETHAGVGRHFLTLLILILILILILDTSYYNIHVLAAESFLHLQLKRICVFAAEL